jgi:hypothetical protein
VKGIAVVNHASTVLAYLGPETVIPLLSVIAGAIGILLVFGRNAWEMTAAVVKRFLRLIRRQ